jgi:hypothetical protein
MAVAILLSFINNVVEVQVLPLPSPSKRARQRERASEMERKEPAGPRAKAIVREGEKGWEEQTE